MYLNHDEIMPFLTDGTVVGSDPSLVNTASLDIVLGDTLLVESNKDDFWNYRPRVLDYGARENFDACKVRMTDEGFVLLPGQFVLGCTVESFNFPNNLAALYRSKSTMGRLALEHMDAGWVDPGFNGVLTLELKNEFQHHSVRIRPGDRIGQLIFMRGNAVRQAVSYATTGNYNGAAGVRQAGFK
mgnify:CR=1 FL=1